MIRPPLKRSEQLAEIKNVLEHMKAVCDKRKGAHSIT